MATEQFPKATTLVRNWLNQGASSRGELLRYLMEIYARPLSIYFLGTSYRTLGEAEDIVHGFFVSYLARDGYLDKWKDSGKRLRRWLANGLLFHCRDLLNEVRRHHGEAVHDEEPAAPPAHTLARFDAEVKGEIVRAAMARTANLLAKRGKRSHWELFELYRVREVPLEKLAEEHGLEAGRAWVMVRTVERNFAKIVREMVAAEIDSTDAKDIDREIESL